MAVYGISDWNHAEDFGVFSTEDEAWAELRRLAEIPWDNEPNRCPCGAWRTCDRLYVLEMDRRTEEQRSEHRRRITELVDAGRPGYADFHAVQRLSNQAEADGRTYAEVLQIGSSGVRWLASH